jgi:hypothetical protein
MTPRTSNASRREYTDESHNPLLIASITAAGIGNGEPFPARYLIRLAVRYDEKKQNRAPQSINAAARVAPKPASAQAICP